MECPPGAHLGICDLAAAEQEKDRLVAALQAAEQAADWARMLDLATALAARFPANGDLQQLRAHALGLLGRRAQALLATGRALALRNQLDPALQAIRQAIVLAPERADAWLQLGLELRDAGAVPPARRAMVRAALADPADPEPPSHLCHLLEYDPSADAATRRAAAAAAADRFGVPGPRPPRRTGGGALRVGFVSGDLINHPVGLFLRSVLPALDPETVRCFAYANSPRVDSTTAAIIPHLAGWRQIAERPDAAVAELVRADGIDLLIDLSGHTQLNRLSLFAGRAAPVQATWLGYFATTGLAAMDWIIADRVVLPPEHEDRYSERPMRLDGCWLAFTDPAQGRARAPGGAPTLGSRHRMSKLNPGVLEAWAAVLRRVPEARFDLRNRSLDDPMQRAAVAKAFARLGVAPDRLTLQGYVDRPAYLASYDALDLALDPFPFGGATTTAEALWMGVPVVTVAADRFAGRMSASLVRHAGLGELVAADPAQYVETAAALAADPARLAALRQRCRAQVPATIGDVAGFATRLTDAFRRMVA